MPADIRVRCSASREQLLPHLISSVTDQSLQDNCEASRGQVLQHSQDKNGWVSGEKTDGHRMPVSCRSSDGHSRRNFDRNIFHHQELWKILKDMP